jgi:hypothetical protein
MNTLFLGVAQLNNLNLKINYVGPNVFSVPAQSVSYLVGSRLQRELRHFQQPKQKLNQRKQN